MGQRTLTIHTVLRSYLAPVFGIVVGVFLLAPALTSAQTFLGGYGTNGHEDGQRRVRPILSNCALEPFSTLDQHGYIAVGSSQPSGQNHSDVWVVRSDNHGTPVWEHRYDFNNGADDFGASIYELTDNTGWVITASTVSAAGDRDIAVFKIDCSGAILWQTVLANPGWDDEASDLIVMTTGTTGAMPPTNPGDIVVVGTSTNINPGPSVPVSSDAYIARLNAVGGLIWDNRYDLSPSPYTPISERLYAVTEVDLFGTQTAADILAVGSVSDNGGPTDGYILRVSGINGTITPGTYQDSRTYGGCIDVPTPFCGPYTGTGSLCGDESFHSVIQLANNNETDGFGYRDVVIVGTTNSPGSNENLTVKLDGGNPAVVDVARFFGPDLINGCINTTETDVAWDVDEVDFEMEGDVVSQWDLAVCGETTGTATNAATEATIMFLSPTTLIPDGTNAYLYGSIDGATKSAKSIHVVSNAGFRTEGFIMGGTKDTYLSTDNLLLIKTNEFGASGDDCHYQYDVDEYQLQWGTVQATPTLTPLGNQAGATLAMASEDQGGFICYSSEEEMEKLPSLAGEATDDVQIQPNVLTSQTQSVSVSLSDVEVEGDIDAFVFSVTGKLMYRARVSVLGNSFHLPTPPLDAGSYILRLDVGKSHLYGWIASR